MSAAVMAVQAAAVAAMNGHAPLASAVSGVFDGPPPDACFPYVAMAESPCVDWSHKSGRGREIRLAITVWDDGARASRLHGVMRDVEAAIEEMPVGLDGWRMVNLRFLRSRVVRDADGPWAGLVEYRVRVMEE
ncbi:DUF3168 domain-containing protein [Rhizorhapis sp. SPR117]|uniref:DUF3168 domain-containing protein n=1 Tax=Rhizorhapis sp. SPR117 TaxID=2912611 RepID=UPI001F18B438|nr:DUF3168 domain-containing protein [Rhizorhapis sp. SPR117]